MLGFYSTDLTFVQKLSEIIHANLENENFGVNDLAHASGVSRNLISKRLWAILNKSTTQFIREIRLNRAKELLAQGTYTAAEVAYMVGFGTPAYFNTCFHAHFGYTPGNILRNGLQANEDVRDEVASKKPAPETGNSSLNSKRSKWALSSGKQLILRSAGLLLLVTVVYFILFGLVKSSTYFPGGKNTAEKSISVLPFKNLNAGEEDQQFVDGITSDIENILVQVTGLRVVLSTPLHDSNGGISDHNKMAKLLDVNYLLTGSIQRAGNRVRISVQLVDIKHNKYIWSEQYDREFFRIFQIQSSIALKVASELEGVISPKNKIRIEKNLARNMEAYSFYVKGCYFLNKRSWKDIDKSRDFFEKAISADPNYADAYAGLAEYYLAHPAQLMVQKSERYLKAKENVIRALELDDYNAEAHAILGELLCYYEWKWEDGQKEYLLAIELNPNSPVVHKHYADFLIAVRQFKEAREHMDLALKLNPTNPSILNSSAHLYIAEGEYEDALKDCRYVLELDSSYYSVYWTLFNLYFRIGSERQAVEAIQAGLNIFPEDRMHVDAIEETYMKKGMRGVLNYLLKLENPETGLLGMSRLYMKLGEKDKALDCLEQVFIKKQPGISLINGKVEYDSIRNNPRFQSLLEKMGLDSYPGNSAVKISKN